ncbi:hypothetical protein ABK040_002660 [Willaertia magna]
MKKAALYIDLDNYPVRPNEYSKILDLIETNYNFELTSKKIFGEIQQMDKIPKEIQYTHNLIVCPKVSQRKNSTDITLTIEVIRDLERKKGLDVFIIGSSDSDYVPVVKAIREEGKECWILPSATNEPPSSLITVCHGVIYVDPKQVEISNNNNATPSTVTSTVTSTSPTLTTSINNNSQTSIDNSSINNTNNIYQNPINRDWICRKCNTNNFAFRTNCFNCQLPKEDNNLIQLENKITSNRQLLSVVKKNNAYTLSQVKLMITTIVQKLELEGAISFNLSYVHERLRDNNIFYKMYGFVTFKSLFEEWRKEQKLFKFGVKSKSGEFVFMHKLDKKQK